MNDDLTLAARLVAMLDHLGLGRAHVAAKAAPYVHPRLASLAVTGEHVIRQGQLSLDERRERALRHLSEVFVEPPKAVEPPVIVGSNKANGHADG
jgi:hypothetical protein